MSKSIRVTDETHEALAKLKGENETFDDLLSRLIEERRTAVREGAGLWEESNAANLARQKRRELKEGVGSQ